MITTERERRSDDPGSPPGLPNGRGRGSALPLRLTLRISAQAAIDAILGNKLRSGLTILGVIMGVASVIVLIAFGQGAKQEVITQIDSLGTNVAVVVPGKNRGEPGFNPLSAIGVTNLSPGDVEALRRVPGVQSVAPLMFVGGVVYRGGRPAKVCMPIATTPEFATIRRLRISAGRFLAAADEDQPVCVLGSAIAQDLFKNENALGQLVTLGGYPVRVAGVAKQRAISSSILGGGDLDAIVYLPLAATQRLTGVHQIHRIFVDVDPRRRPGPILDRIRQVMLAQHRRNDDFSIFTSKELLEMFFKIFNLLAALLAGISSISLLVGGIGIMNIMLVSVTERTREIGIRKTVGARRRDIFFQFLSEAVTLSVIGGVLGMALAFGGCAVARKYTPLTPLITWQAGALGVSVCVGVGIVFGVAPAVKAARKDPIEAIRHE